MTGSITCYHFDASARRVLELRIEASIDPGQKAVTRLDPGACEPEIAPYVEEVRFTVCGVQLMDRAGCSEHLLHRGNGLLSAPAAEALAREFEARYHAEDGLRSEVDLRLLTTLVPER